MSLTLLVFVCNNSIFFGWCTTFLFCKQSTGEFPKPGIHTNLHSQHQQSQQALSSSSILSNHTSGGAGHLNSAAQHPPPTAAYRVPTPQTTSSLSSTTSLAACQVTPGSEYILCKILFHDAVHKTYKLADEDIESNKSTFLCFLSCSLLSFVS